MQKKETRILIIVRERILKNEPFRNDSNLVKKKYCKESFFTENL